MRAALLVEHNKPLVVADVVPMYPLHQGQVLVRVERAGICGSQLAEIRGEKGGPLPHLLGHEGVGVVHDTGEGVTLLPGQRVVIHWRKGAGIECDEFPQYGYGDQIITSGKAVAFAELAVCSENRLTPIPDDVDADVCALLGCGLSTALACVENDAALRLGERVLVVGCGGLGLNLIAASRIRGAADIVGLDIAWSTQKEALVFAAGAQFFTSELPPHTKGFDVIFDTTGLGAWVERLASGGRYIFVGQPPRGVTIALNNALHLFDGEGKTIKATQGGGFVPQRDIPRYVALWRAGAINTKALVSHRVTLENINDGLDLMRAGKAGRVMVDIFA